MPGYGGTGRAQTLNYNQQMYLWQNETVPVNGSSIAVQLRRSGAEFYPWGVSFELVFSGAPGTFEVDIQTSDTDADTDFVTINTMTSGLNGSNVGRLELPIFWAKYVRGNLVSLQNAVTVSLKVTR